MTNFPLLRMQSFPCGMISSEERLLDIVSEATEINEKIKIYFVGQRGFLAEGYLLPNTEINKEKGSIKAEKYEYKTDINLNDWNVTTQGYNRNAIFTNKILAEKYSNILKNDEKYIAEVKRWHEYCDRMFGSWWK